MIDRRKNPREFFVAGWDPYILSLVSDGKGFGLPPEYMKRSRKLGPTRWRTMLVRQLRTESSRRP